MGEVKQREDDEPDQLRLLQALGEEQYQIAIWLPNEEPSQ